jgi:long-chain acyl-CoA synthetase
VPRHYRYPDVGPVRLLDDAAADFPDAVALEYHRYRMTYRKLVDHVDRMATALTAMGARPGDRVALLLPDCPQLVIGLFAAWRVGASVSVHRPDGPALVDAAPRVVITLDRWYQPHVAPLRGDLPEATQVVVTARHDYFPFPANVVAPLRRMVRRRSQRIPPSERVLRFSELVRRTSPAPARATPTADDRPTVHLSDAALTRRQLVINSFQLRLWMPDVVAGDERVLLTLPMHSSLGVLWLVCATLSAATMVFTDDRRAAGRPRVALRSKPTILPFDHRLADALLGHGVRRARLASVRIALAGQPLSPELRGRMETITDKGRIRRIWGVRGVVTHADPVYGRADPTTVGLPLPDTDVVVVDTADPGVAMPVGRRGRLWMRGPQLSGGAWLDTCLEATVGSDGYLTVHAGPGSAPIASPAR